MAKYIEKAAIQVEKINMEREKKYENSRRETRQKEGRNESKGMKEMKEARESKENIKAKGKNDSKTGKEQKENKDAKNQVKIPKKKTAYKIYFDERTAQLRNNPEGKSNGYKEIQMPEISSIAAKEWKEMTNEEKKKYFDKADEYNIIIEDLPQKSSRMESGGLSDTESEVIPPAKKSKNS